MRSVQVLLLLVLAMCFAVSDLFAADNYQLLRSSPAGYAAVVPGKNIQFPRDHLPHSAFKIEWWYLTANLTDDSGGEYGVHWTLFRQSMSPDEPGDSWSNNQIWMAHAAISTPEGHLYEERFARGGIGQAGVQVNPEGAFSGCMESTASNYNANAAIDNGSCVWNWRPYESTFMNWGGKPQTNKTTDGFRYIWEVDSMEVLSAYDAANSKLRGRWKISKVCESKPSCGEPSTEPNFANRTLPTITVSTGTIAHPNGVSFSDWTTAKNTAKSQGQSAINTLFANHVAPPCREGQTNISNWSGFVPQPCDNSFSLTVKRSMVYCDNSNDWIRAEYTLNRDGVAQQTWTVSNNTSYTSSLNDAMRAQHLNTSTGNYSWIDGAQALVDAHETALSTTTTTEDYKINNGWRRSEIPANKVIDKNNYNFFLPWATRTLTTTSCGTKQSQGNSYISIYRFRETGGLLNTKPSVTKTSDGKLEVKYDGEILTPFETFTTTGLTQAQKDALTEPYYAKIGCMDASATNYDPEANANSKPGGSSVACVWDCTEDDGRGLMPNCRTCLPDADKNPVDMVFDVSTNTWSCPATGGDGGDPPLDEEPSILDSEWLPFAAIGGLILLALGMG